MPITPSIPRLAEGKTLDAKEAIGKVTSQVTSLLERSVEIKFFLHILCGALYLQLATPLAISETASGISWTSLANLPPPKLLALLVGYFAIMGYICRILYAFVFYGLNCANIRLSLSTRTRWSDISGMVHKDDVMQYAHTHDKPELALQLEEHRKACRQDHRESSELAYLSFTTIALLILGHFSGCEGLIDVFQEYTGHHFSDSVLNAVIMILIFPLFLIVWSDISADYDRENYLEHRPLYDELKREKNSAPRQIRP